MLYAGFAAENRGVPAVPQQGSEPFEGFPVSGLNIEALRAQRLPFSYKIIRHDQASDRKSRECGSESTRKKLLDLLATRQVTIIVRPH